MHNVYKALTCLFGDCAKRLLYKPVSPLQSRFSHLSGEQVPSVLQWDTIKRVNAIRQGKM